MFVYSLIRLLHFYKLFAFFHKICAFQLDANIFVVMQVRYPRICSWIKFLVAARRKCLICEEPEPKRQKQKSDFVTCPNPDCHFVYCSECWRDVKHVCYACSSVDEDTDDDGDLELILK